MSNRRVVEVTHGWMVIYYGEPYTKLFSTRKEARAYRAWKTSNNPFTWIVKAKQITTLVFPRQRGTR